MLRKLLYFTLLCSLIFMMENSSYAQDEQNASVQVDIDALNDIEPAAGTRYYRPAQPIRPQRPMLTAPSKIKRQPAPPPIMAPSNPSLADQQTKKRELVSFPVNIKERTEIYDPSLAATPAHDFEKEEVKPVKVIDTPLPDLKPIKTVPRKLVKKAPVPPSLPAAKKHKKSAQKSLASIDKKVIDLSQNGPGMPAVPPQKVSKETLSPPQQDAKESYSDVTGYDALASQLVTPDKLSMVQSVEKIAAFADALTPMFSNDDTHAMYKENSVVNVPTPSRKPDFAKQIAQQVDEAIKLSALEPASGSSQTKVASLVDITEPVSKKTERSENNIPRKPPEDGFELEYISLPFSPALDDIDQQIAQSLDGEIIPLLQNNPQWRLQIQSFASKGKQKAKNARRTSLSRALAVRTHLLNNGIEAHRMDVRALGMQTDRNPADRVDFVFFDPSQN